MKHIQVRKTPPSGAERLAYAKLFELCRDHGLGLRDAVDVRIIEWSKEIDDDGAEATLTIGLNTPIGDGSPGLSLIIVAPNGHTIQMGILNFGDGPNDWDVHVDVTDGHDFSGKLPNIRCLKNNESQFRIEETLALQTAKELIQYFVAYPRA